MAPANLLKKRLWHLYFPVNFANFNFHHWTNEITNKYTWFPHKIFVLQKVKGKECCCFRCAICHTSWSFLNQTRRAFFCSSPMFHVCAEACTCNRMPRMPKPVSSITFPLLFFSIASNSPYLYSWNSLGKGGGVEFLKFSKMRGFRFFP